MKFPVTILLLLTVLCAQGQKVALVLSGGGAKGAAHIGVIRALEENQIPIDYVAGTSIGAIIGGLYAAGWSPDEMEKLITSDEFLNWAYGIIDEKYTYYFKMRDPSPSWAVFRFNKDSIWQFNAPTNLISSSQMDFIFMEIFSQASAIAKNNFDSLFIPFRCIGSNINKQRAEVFRNGELGTAVRASMTYPFYFKPITINGEVYMDGGMYNNFPVDAVRNDFDPDIIIGVKVASGNNKPSEDNVMSQLENIFMASTNYQLPCNSSVLIEPKIPSVNVIDFKRSKEFIDMGYASAIEKIPEIRMFVTDSISVKALNHKRDSFKNRRPPFVFKNIELSGLSENQKKFFIRSFNKNDSSKTLEKVKQNYFDLIADDRIQSIYPIAKYDSLSNKFVLHLNVKSQPNFVVQFGGLVSSNPVNEAFAEVEYNNLNRLAYQLSAGIHVGRFYSAGQAKIKFEKPGKYPATLSIGVNYQQWDYFKTTTRFFEDKKPSYLIENDQSFFAILAFPAGNYGRHDFALRPINANHKYFQTNSFSREDIPDQTKLTGFHYSYSFERNTLNKKQYAFKGTFLLLKSGLIDGKETTTAGSTAQTKADFVKKHHYYYGLVRYKNYFKTTRHFIIGFNVELYASNRELFNFYLPNMTFAPTYTPVYEMRTLLLPQFGAQQFAGMGFENIIKINKNFDWRTEAYLFQPYKSIKKSENTGIPSFSDPFEFREGVAKTALVFHSPVGPLSLSLCYFTGEDDPFLISFNMGYILFYPRSYLP